MPSDSLLLAVAVPSPFLPPLLDEIVDSTEGADGRSGGAGDAGGLPSCLSLSLILCRAKMAGLSLEDKYSENFVYPVDKED